MLKLLAFAAVASTISVALTVYLLDIWADIKNFRIFIKSAEKKQAYAFLLDAVVKTLVYFIAVIVLPAILKKFYN
jgi:hypothetical protein